MFPFSCFKPIKRPFSIKFPKPFDLKAHFPGQAFARIEAQTFYCKDSRGEELNFGAPGGDFGEFLLAASVGAGARRSDFSSDAANAETLLKDWIEKKCSKERPFYLHTDEAALKRIFEHLQLPFTADLSSLSSPGERDAFLSALCEGPANFHGCGHLRLIREREDEYGISKALMNHLFRAFFALYWAGDERVLLKVYNCDLEGSGLAIIYGPAEAKESLLGRQRLANGQQCFILNQHSVSIYRRDHLAPFFEAETGALERKGNENTMRTAEALASGKPIYRIDLS